MVSSSIVMPMPITVPPMIWLRAVFSLRMRPASTAETSRAMRKSPRSASIRTSAKCAANGRGGCHTCTVWLRVDFAIGGDLIELVAGEDVDVGLTHRRVVDEVNAAVRDGDVVRTPALQRRPVVVGDDVEEGAAAGSPRHRGSRRRATSPALSRRTAVRVASRCHRSRRGRGRCRGRATRPQVASRPCRCRFRGRWPRCARGRCRLG